MEDNFNQIKKHKILLIEDDPFLIKMYQDKFVLEGFEVLVAEDGKVGLKMALEEDISLVILDLLIPQLQGIELLKKLRESEKGKLLPVVVLTNLTKKEKQQEAMKLGVKDFLIKADLTPGELVVKIKKILGMPS